MQIYTHIDNINDIMNSNNFRSDFCFSSIASLTKHSDQPITTQKNNFHHNIYNYKNQSLPIHYITRFYHNKNNTKQ